MKLTTEQLDLISKEIIQGGIRYQDLYEELLDHYITAIGAQATFALSLFNCFVFIPRVVGIELKAFSPQIQVATVATLICFYLAYSLSFYQLYNERFKIKIT